LLGGAATSIELLERATARDVPVLVSYGLTEACSQVTTTPFGTTPRTEGNLVSSGRPLPGVELRVRADDRICIRGPTLADGLLGDRLPRDEEGFLLTDDLGRRDANGELFVYGRASDRIVSGGENVDPLRVEAVLLSEPTVRAACVFGIPDARYGELVACALVVSPAFEPALCLRRLESELVPEARPRQVALLETLPELASGKIDRAAVRAHARQTLRAWSALTARAGRTPT
jgi:O-succinylbenzoic acid--CoA ligase